MAAGGGNITVTMTRLDGDRENVKLKLSKQTTVHAIKTRCEMEFGIAPIEQLLLFRGRPLLKDSFQPLSTPDLQDIIAEAGEDGLQMAVAYQELKLPAFLKREGLEDVNMKRSSGATPLHRAVRQCELNVVEELLRMDEFSGVNARDRSGQTALHTATECWQREAAGLLLASDRFGTPAAVDLEGRTALHLVAHWGDEEVCRQILEHKSFTADDAYLLDSQGHTALEYATACGHEAVSALISERCPPSAVSPQPVESQEATAGAALESAEATASTTHAPTLAEGGSDEPPA